jgi:hypothetical protein
VIIVLVKETLTVTLFLGDFMNCTHDEMNRENVDIELVAYKKL